MYLLTLLHLFLFSITADTNYVKIHIEIDGQNVNMVRFYIPNNNFFDGNDNPNYSDLQGEKYFNFKIPLNKSSFIELGFNNEYGFPLAAIPGDSISIKIIRYQKTDYPAYDYIITGSHATAHNIYLSRFYPAGKNLGFLDDLPKKSKTYSEYYLHAKNYIDSVTAVWDSLKQKNEISNDIYQLYQADTKGCLYDVAIRRMSLVKPVDSGWASYAKWLKLKQVMYYYADAANPIHLKTYVGAYLYQNYLRNIIKDDDGISDTLLKSSDLGYYYYYDSSYREEAWGGMLWTLKEMFPTSASQENLNDLEAFKKYYPHSYYFDKVNKFQDSILAERKSLPEKIHINKIDYHSIKDIMGSIEGRYFFIDVWATWCKPCIQEFNNYTQLSKFLINKNIKEVFLSINQKQDFEIWENFIAEQHLSGYHFIINEDVQKELFNIISEGKVENSFFIPRYLFYDKKLDKYSIDLPRPSTGIILESVIDDILNNNKDL